MGDIFNKIVIKSTKMTHFDYFLITIYLLIMYRYYVLKYINIET